MAWNIEKKALSRYVWAYTASSKPSPSECDSDSGAAVRPCSVRAQAITMRKASAKGPLRNWTSSARLGSRLRTHCSRFRHETIAGHDSVEAP